MNVLDAALLVVDDNEDNRYTLTRRLTREGYTNVVTANDGRQALEVLRSRGFDLVLLDISMPELNGYQVLEQMKADAALSDVPVVMISAIEETESVVRCIELGADDYLSKPFDPTLLRARVHATLEKKRLRDAVRTHAEQLEEWNSDLERRVHEQLAQLDRLGKLKGFFSPQVVASILDGGGEDLLKTHRREVVVAFLDMRGFTAFTDHSEPEEVMAVLTDYHRVMGPLILKHEGTLERFAGDGMMVFFNDPVQIANPSNECGAHGPGNAGPSSVRCGTCGRSAALTSTSASGSPRATRPSERSDSKAAGTTPALAAPPTWPRGCAARRWVARCSPTARRSRVSKMPWLAEALGERALKGIAQPTPVFNITGMRDTQ